MLNMGLWRSSSLPPLLSPHHFRDASISRDSPDASARSSSLGRGSGSWAGPSSQSEQRAATGGPAASDSTAAVVAAPIPSRVDLPAAAALGAAATGHDSGSGGELPSRDVARGDGASSSCPASPALRRVSTSSLARGRTSPIRLSPSRRSPSGRDLVPRPRLLQLYQVRGASVGEGGTG